MPGPCRRKSVGHRIGKKHHLHVACKCMAEGKNHPFQLIINNLCKKQRPWPHPERRGARNKKSPGYVRKKQHRRPAACNNKMYHKPAGKFMAAKKNAYRAKKTENHSGKSGENPLFLFLHAFQKRHEPECIQHFFFELLRRFSRDAKHILYFLPDRDNQDTAHLQL